MGGERRQYPRLSAPLEAEYLVAGAERWQAARLHDVSAGGVGLLVEDPDADVAKLESVRFRLDPKAPPIELLAEMLHFRTDESGATVAGVRFREPDEESVQEIQNYVFDRLIEQNAELLGEGEEWTGRVDWSELVQVRYDHFTRFVSEVTENLSLTGMFIQSDTPLDPGSIFDFRIQLNDDFALIQGKAEVVWMRTPNEDHDQPSGMGVRFLELTDESRELISRIVHQQTDESTDSEELPALGLSDSASESSAKSGDPKRSTSNASSARMAKRLKAQLDRIRDKARSREEEYRGQIEKAAQTLAAFRVRVSELEQQSLDLRNELDRERTSHQEQVESVATNRDQLFREIEELHTERDRLSADLEVEKEISKKLDQEGREAARERAELESSLEEEQERAKRLERDLGTLEKQLEEARAEPVESGELEKLRSELEDLGRSLTASETARNRIKESNQAAYEKERAASKSLAAAEKARDKMRRERDKARRALKAAEKKLAKAGASAPDEEGDTGVPELEQIAALESERDALRQELETARRDEQRATARLDELAQANEQAERDLEGLRGAAEALDYRLREARTERDEARALLDAERQHEPRAAQEDLDLDLDLEEADRETLLEAVLEARRRIAGAEASSESRVREIEGEVEELRNSLSTSETARRQIAKQASAAAAQEKTLRQQLQEVQDLKRDQGAELEKSETEKREIAARLAALEIDLEAATAEQLAAVASLEEERERLAQVPAPKRKGPLRAAALVAAGTFAGLLAGSVFFSGSNTGGTSVPKTLEATTLVADRSESATASTEAPTQTSGAIESGAIESGAVETEPTDPAPDETAPIQTATSDPHDSDPVVSQAQASAASRPAAVEALRQATPPSASISVESSVTAWAEAWAEQDVDGYLAAYDVDFVPPKSLDRSAWSEQRRTRIERPEWIRVTIRDMKTTPVSADRARAVFTQEYETPTYRDQVTKTLHLTLRDGRWMIVQETSSSS